MKLKEILANTRNNKDIEDWDDDFSVEEENEDYIEDDISEPDEDEDEIDEHNSSDVYSDEIDEDEKKHKIGKVIKKVQTTV